MKSFISLLVFISIFNLTFSQNDIPSTQLTSMDGDNVNSDEVFAAGQPILLVFWATWCTHTSTGLTTIQDDYFDDWKEQFNIKVVAVSVDDAKSSNRVPLVANTKGWEFDIFLDLNGDLKRAMGVNNAPFVFLLDSEGKIIWQQNAYNEGDEERIEEELSKL
jgi:cytochrome c biogenesis protein CcmG/thiol:disulfide interchange protein DsbE